ncbi:hypothetical protein WICMUC_001138 [Wickerhamomyces mucosus]|uniref:Uncharacterized protein n=1 Tax=Wickerhamomyces mucosus TaxID=1378264 RepID=A0A9P8PVM1_9ASCO|nr:hypothetical protein WICMUC_001138 [Wickerhamomyces mucosus]
MLSDYNDIENIAVIYSSSESSSIASMLSPFSSDTTSSSSSSSSSSSTSSSDTASFAELPAEPIASSSLSSFSPFTSNLPCKLNKVGNDLTDLANDFFKVFKMIGFDALIEVLFDKSINFNQSLKIDDSVEFVSILAAKILNILREDSDDKFWTLYLIFSGFEIKTFNNSNESSNFDSIKEIISDSRTIYSFETSNCFGMLTICLAVVPLPFETDLSYFVTSISITSLFDFRLTNSNLGS